MSDILVFLKRFVSRPGQIGSVIPSSRFLCKLMMEQVPWGTARSIVELGPGTGVFTQAILKRKRPGTVFFAVERDPMFQQMLRERFPGLTIRDEAVKLATYLGELHLAEVDVIISGLPFAVFPDWLRTAILDTIYESLSPGGVFVTFQYSLQLKSELEQRFGDIDIGFTPLNIPPAFVYTCRKKT